MIVFLTYGDEAFKLSKEKIKNDAEKIGIFDKVLEYGRGDLSKELNSSPLLTIKRGGGLWSWKPDVIWQTIEKLKDGDIVIYCDSGCTLSPSREWNWYLKKLETCELVAQRIPMRNDKWTRKEVLDYFQNNGKKWELCYQYEATAVVLKVGLFSRKFICDWRNLILTRPDFVMDVNQDEIDTQHKSFIENRHDQTIYSALIYKYLKDAKWKGEIFTCWSKIEDCSVLYKQAIRATRLRYGEKEGFIKKNRRMAKWILRQGVLIPFYFSPKQWLYSK